MIIDERRRERDDGAIDAERVHSLDLPGRFEKRRVQTEMHAAHIEIDALALMRLTRDGKFGARLHELEELVRNKMTVNIRDHPYSPR